MPRLFALRQACAVLEGRRLDFFGGGFLGGFCSSVRGRRSLLFLLFLLRGLLCRLLFRFGQQFRLGLWWVIQ